MLRLLVPAAGPAAPHLVGRGRQRLTLAIEIHKKGSVYVMDEPTTGLTCPTSACSCTLLIEHHLDVIRQADWIVDLGPEGESAGGEVLCEGPPQGLKGCTRSITARFL